MKSDLTYQMIKDIKREGDIYFEATISAIDFPLIVNDDWNNKLFKLIKKEKSEFLEVPNEKKLNVIVTCLMIHNKEYLDILEKSQRIFEEK